MSTSHSFKPSLQRLGRLAASVLLVAPVSTMLQAQAAPSAPVSSTASQEVPTPALKTLNFDLQAALHAPLDPSSSSSSSSTTGDSAAAADRLSLEADPGGDGNMQPPPRRRRYGQPNYNDRWHNSDGSNRIAFLAGVGLNVPVGSASSNYLGTNFRFEAGAGINFSQKLAVLFQFDYDRFSIPGNILQNQEILYSKIDTVDSFAGLDGNAHIWSLSVNPTLTFYQGDKWGGYGVVGAGFYHKVSNFTVPSVQEYCDYYGYCYQYQANQIIDHYFSNAPGVTGGAGLTYKLSKFANQKLFAEVRFVHTFNSARLGDPTYTGSTNGQAGNLYPPNSNETSYIPITVGIKF